MERTQSGPGGARTAVVWAALRAEFGGPPARTVLDVGGGTGGFAVPLARYGHQVTVIDPSPDALAALARRAAEAGVADRVTGLQGDADRLADLVAPAAADLVLCHSVLEYVDDPAQVVAALAGAVRPGGAASVLVANAAAAVLSRALAGHFAAARALLADPSAGAGPADRLRRRFDPLGASALLAGAGLSVLSVHGVRVVADLLPGALADADPEELTRFELAVADRPPFRDLATALHLYARRPA